MRPRFGALSAAIVVATTVLVADQMSIDFDPAADFSQFKTFAIGETKIQSLRPELDNPLFVKMLATAARTTLARRGLTEAPSGPHLVVSLRLSNEDVSTTQRGMAMPAAPGMRGRGSGPQPVRFTEGTLVIELTRPGDGAPVWRGVYRDDERTGSKLVQRLPEDAKKLLERYPPKVK
jgi:hypothetical protein